MPRPQQGKETLATLARGSAHETKRRHQAVFLICETGSSATRRYPAVLRSDEILENANVLCLPAFSPFGHCEFNRLTFLQTAVSAALNRREMYKDILSTLTRDKTKAFVGVEPLNCSLFHYVFPIHRFDAGMKYRVFRKGTKGSSCRMFNSSISNANPV